MILETFNVFAANGSSPVAPNYLRVQMVELTVSRQALKEFPTIGSIL